nr:flavin reductase (NADPH)-like [Nerophis lumbriciformis]
MRWIDELSTSTVEPMKTNEQLRITLLGATGGTGRAFLELALAAGHRVTVLVRSAAKLERTHPNLNVIEGDALDRNAMTEAIAGRDAVVSALGAPPRSKTQIRSRATALTLEVMKETGVKRLVSLSSHGVGDSAGSLPFLYKYVLVPLLLRRVFEDHAAQEAHILASDVDWTIVRPPALTDATGTQQYVEGLSFDAKASQMKIPREDVAMFMLRELHLNRYRLKTAYVAAPTEAAHSAAGLVTSASSR